MKRTRTVASVLPMIATVLILWSLLAPWAAVFPGGAGHYKVSLFGVRHVMGIEADAPQTRCGWGDSAAPCRPAPGARGSYSALASARWLMLLSIGLLLAATGFLARPRHAARRAAVLMAAALSAACCILLVRANVASALAVVSGTRLLFAGSGMTAAIGAAIVCAASALLVAGSRPAAGGWAQDPRA